MIVCFNKIPTLFYQISKISMIVGNFRGKICYHCKLACHVTCCTSIWKTISIPFNLGCHNLILFFYMYLCVHVSFHYLWQIDSRFILFILLLSFRYNFITLMLSVLGFSWYFLVRCIFVSLIEQNSG